MAQKDDAAFEEFVTADLSRLLGFGQALTGNRHDAWDLTQEALARVGLRWARVAKAGNPGAYARTTMVRLNIDRLRRLRRERPVADLPEFFAEVSVDHDVPAWLTAALEELTPRQRTAIVLRYVADLDTAGIAREMQCSVGTAKSHLSGGMERLRGHVASMPSGSGLDTDGVRSDG